LVFRFVRDRVATVPIQQVDQTGCRITGKTHWPAHRSDQLDHVLLRLGGIAADFRRAPLRWGDHRLGYGGTRLDRFISGKI